MKTIHIFFGEMGVGKNYHAERYAKEHRCVFFDGDSVIPPKMKERITNFQSLDELTVKGYIVMHLLPAIYQRAVLSVDDLVVAQALYRNASRLSIRDFLEGKGFRVRFHWVIPSVWQNLKQLWTDRGYRWVWYWLRNKPFFQFPSHAYTPHRSDY
jgi:hypothetical protein